ncbi:unconventional myosin-XVI-like isoform X2 [Haliotis asinina]|uniref:unconventional myosin-XVI-like isoform X2 n=1 Tax=Haliotis asinina TaxID=109174 RepID=UPI003531BB37
MTFGIDQTSLEALPQHERIKVCKQIRQKQIENYVCFLSEQGRPPVTSRPNKKNTTVHFSVNHLLQTAIESFNDREVDDLVKGGADVNFTTANNTTLLHKCCMVGNARAAEVLIGGGAYVNARDDDWWTPLHVACYHDNVELVKLLLGSGADITLMDVDGNFVFDHIMHDFEVYDIITQQKDEMGLTPSQQVDLRRERCHVLYAAVQKELDAGQNVNAASKRGITWLHMASANGYRSVVKLLLNNNADVNVTDDIGWTPLHVAAKYCQVKVARQLLKHGADCEREDQHGRKPVEVAGTDEVQRVLQEARRNIITGSVIVNSQDSDNELEDMETIVSKTMHTAHMDLSRSDKLLESQIRYGQQGAVHAGMDEDEDEASSDTAYVSAIWRVADFEEASPPMWHMTDDLTTFTDLTEKTMVETLQTRYADKLIYTYIGDILLAVNPFMELPYYAKSISREYHDCHHLTSLSPHVFAVAEQAHRHLVSCQMSQCCVISGESGSGKTESCKFLVQHLLRVSESTETGLSSKINQVNPLLEAFGNARTVMNDNSSRFAKCLEVSYSMDGGIVGAKMTQYLLEKSRVVHQGRGERNFHIFYWMLSGITPEEASCCLFDKEFDFSYLQCDGRDVQHKLVSEDRQKFWDVKNCLQYVGFASEDVMGLTTTLAAILHLGNVRFVSILEHQACDVDNYNTLQKVCKLLRVEFEDLRQSLVEESMTARGEELRRPLSVCEAEDSRDALAKALYSRLFSWLVNGINNTIQPIDPSEANFSVSVLDIFGFENLKSNGFEQICINLANEQLQMFFNEQVFQQERQDCLLEGVPVTDVSCHSNHCAINLFLEKNTGILALLDEESSLKQATDRSLANKLHQGPGEKYPGVYKTPRDKGTTFTIIHYAGSISYNLTGMLDKNRDTLRGALGFVMRSSTSLLIKDLFQAGITKTGSIKPSSRQLSLQRELSFKRQLKTSKSPFEFFKKLKSPKMERPEQRRERLTATGTTRKGPATMAYQFKNSLTEMMAKLQSCEPHFIRCIRPNETRSALGFNTEYVKAQLLYTGVLETVRIRKHGYSLRISFTSFLTRYNSIDILVTSLRKGMVTPEQACRDIMHHCGITDYQIGKSKVFLRQVQVDTLDEKLREIKGKVIRCQAAMRGFTARRQRKRSLKQMKVETDHIAEFMAEVVRHQSRVSDWLRDEMDHDTHRQDTTTRLQREASKSLEALDRMLDVYECEVRTGIEVLHLPEGKVTPPTYARVHHTVTESSTDDDVYMDCTSGVILDFTDQTSISGESFSRTEDSGVEEGDEECYRDGASTSGRTLTACPQLEDMDSERQFPPSPRDMYHGLYETIPANGHKVDKRHPPSVPERAPETRLSTFSPRSSSASSGIYNEPDDTSTQWQTSTPTSPRVKTKLIHGIQQGSPRHQENKPFSYGVSFPTSPKHQSQGHCNGSDLNGQRGRTGSTGSSHSSENPYARWIHLDQEESDLPPFPVDSQPAYQQVHCVPNSSVYDGHSPTPPYGLHSSQYTPHTGRVNPVPPPVPPPNPCHSTVPVNVSSQIQQLKNNAISSHPQFPHPQSPRSPGSPKMVTKLHSLKVGPKIPDQSMKMEHPVPPPPNFPAPPPPVSPQDRYQAVVQDRTRGRSPSPPLPPPPLDGTINRGMSAVPPPPPPISTIPTSNAKATRAKERDVTRPNPPAQNGDEVKATQLMAEIGNIKLKRVNSPQAVPVPPMQPVMDNSGGSSPLNFRLRPTPNAVDIYKDGRDDTTKDMPVDELPPPPPPELEPEPEPEPTRPVAVVTAQPNEQKTKPGNKGKKERSPLPYNMDLEIPDDIDISSVPGVVPITQDTPNWKREMVEKKNREKIEEYVRKILREREEQAKWKDVPEWKRKILMKKSQEEQEAALAKDALEEPKPVGKKAPQIERPSNADCGVPKTNTNITPAAMAMDPAELESMPPWKRELLFKREKVPMTFFNEYNPEEEDEAPPS